MGQHRIAKAVCFVCCAVILQEPDKHLGKLVPVNAGSLTMAEACKVVSEVIALTHLMP